ncbi:succinate dehydrogenase/fumarate reductase flavoprotein subunit [Motilibacter rhizosphaerae]|uniref:Succinate dehydrogenase/fumarate reductase flavoprotein subunit n=1 Tax=Motilibacter rhizosphaerae TaxID=598652 RepID=A0A4V2F4X6_9ACTN|nr:FAD-binding protein [Motilibacter rhizosphaerae]RZS90849.1 succinate dehydrogenase/fumarate reductase flavoprotein subunit [Motilibacter rhizosphaerae]
MALSPATRTQTDVLVVGGGPAGTWAAIRAARAGASVVLADKAFCGTSGSTAAAGTGIWYVEPTPDAREAAMASREGLGGYLADRRWMQRVLDETYARVDELTQTPSYPFPVDESGAQYRRGLQGPDYMRRQRIRLKRLGVEIRDHSPVTDLLVDADGAVAGARGVHRRTGEEWEVRAGAVVLATGACAFKQKALGTDVATGDGALLAAEVGAAMSGMEFSNSYGIAPEGTTVTKTAYYSFATFYREDGSVLEGAKSQGGRKPIARELQSGRKVLARLDKADAFVQTAIRLDQPNFLLPFDRLGIDPFRDMFPVTLILEGTVRGTGGVAIVDDGCSAGVPGLYVAGDTATRELICGGFTGGGSHNAAWAISSGSFAGTTAAAYALALKGSSASRPVQGAGGAGLRPGRRRGAVTTGEVVAAVQAQVAPYDINYFRTAERLEPALQALHGIWAAARDGLADAEPWRAREAAAMAAHGRWMYTAALARTESRGMHWRADFPTQDPAQHGRLLTGGLDDVWTRPERALAGVAS